MEYRIPEEEFHKICLTLLERGFVCDGCRCGDFVYNLADKKTLTVYRSCHKSNNTPPGKSWLVHEPEMYNGSIGNYTLTPTQKSFLMALARMKSKEELGYSEDGE